MGPGMPPARAAEVLAITAFKAVLVATLVDDVNAEIIEDSRNANSWAIRTMDCT